MRPVTTFVNSLFACPNVVSQDPICSVLCVLGRISLDLEDKAAGLGNTAFDGRFKVHSQSK
jgi:hypothetical protein